MSPTDDTSRRAFLGKTSHSDVASHDESDEILRTIDERLRSLERQLCSVHDTQKLQTESHRNRRWLPWLLLIVVGIGTDVFSDVYFHVGGRITGGVDPHAYDLLSSILIIVGLIGLVVADLTSRG